MGAFFQAHVLIFTGIGSVISSTVNMKIPMSHLSHLRRIRYNGLADMKVTLNNFQVQRHKNSSYSTSLHFTEYMQIGKEVIFIQSMID